MDIVPYSCCTQPMARDLTRGQRVAAEQARLRAAERGFTQRDLAGLLDASEKAVHNFLNGKTWPHSRSLAGYERALGYPSGRLARVAREVDEEAQSLQSAAPEERHLLELISELRVELDGQPIGEYSHSVQRAVDALAEQLANLGADVTGPRENVRLFKVRPVSDIAAELDHEIALRLDTLSSNVPGREAIAKRIHDLKIEALQAELELARRHGESSVTGS